MSGEQPVYRFECRVYNAPWPEWTSITARSAAQAKSIYLSEVRDPWPDVKYIDIRVRKVGKPKSSADFLRVAKMRGLPDARCGDRIITSDGKHRGVIVGHNDSANFDILFDSDDPSFPNQILNVHPHELRIVRGDEHDARGGGGQRA